MDGLGVGRIVHYRALDYSEEYQGTPVCRAAIVTEVNDAERGEASLTVFEPGGTVNGISCVSFDGDAKPWDTWHWPERA